MQAALLQFRFIFQLLDKVAVPVEAADECFQPCGVAAFGLGGGQPRLLLQLTQADAAPGQIGRQPRTGPGAVSGPEIPPR